MDRRCTRVSLLAAAALVVVLGSCHASQSSGGSAAPSGAASGQNADARPVSPATTIDPCSKFSQADAQAIMGVPMKLSPGHGPAVCMYEEASPKAGLDSARVSFTLKVRRSLQEEDRAWNNTRVIRRLKDGEKNITQLSGIGDEAWFDGHIEKGKVDAGGVLVRKGKSDFALESATLAYRASAVEIKKIAQRIAGDLP